MKTETLNYAVWGLASLLAGGCTPQTRDSGSLESGSGSGAGSSAGGDTDREPTASSSGGGEGDSSTGPAGSSTGPGDSEGGDSGDSIRFDVAGGSDGAGDGSLQGCGKVDFLFIVDNSGSMADEQQNLIQSFPGFIQAIQGTINAQNYQILVTDSDTIGGGGNCMKSHRDPPCDAWCADCLAEGCSCTCNGMPCQVPPSSCEGVLGAGHRANGAGADCGVDGDDNYMGPSQADLAGTFACLADVGIGGSGDEKIVQSMLDAAGPTLGSAGNCNEGFIREDAILVVTFITDEDGGTTTGTPQDWKQSLVDIKNGDENAIVMLGVVGDTDLPGALCPEPTQGNPEGAQGAPDLREFAEAFPFGQWVSVCEPDYSPFFAEAVGVIDIACDEFVPPG